MLKKSAWLIALLAMGFSQPAQAQQLLGPFDQALSQYTQDGVLDSQEYAYLRQLSNKILPEADQDLARHFLAFAGKHSRFIHMSYSYYRASSQVSLKFAFAPTYTEDSFIQGQTSRELLSQISQNDVLSETTADAQRCGAAALLSAHYLLYGNLDQAFSLLNIQNQGMTYRTVHLAQEALYRAANTDGQAGLVSMFRYTLYDNGNIDKPTPDGEIKQAAQAIKLKVHPMIGPRKDRFYDKQQAVTAFWRMYPEAVFLVGVYLDDKKGGVRAPAAGFPQNHFVLVFRQNNSVWLLNSGVLDNGNHSALFALNNAQIQAFLYQTTGSVDAITRQ